MTLGELYNLAKDTLWRGKATEPQALQRCKSTIAHLGPETPLLALNAVSVDDLIKHLQADRSDASVNRYLSALHTLLRWGLHAIT